MCRSSGAVSSGSGRREASHVANVISAHLSADQTRYAVSLGSRCARFNYAWAENIENGEGARPGVFTRERFTYALVRTLTLGVRMQTIQSIYCAISFSDWAAVTHEARRACREPSAEY